ncbi:ubiquitin carboxyl-terminal hydrolase MINDY-1-like isoform X2 [Zophobas morio]|uniref:ubiquitin carboxyl-terminal hydrolase MINDY-1-like isoform X2 n=1 Tax=Zophobas morio TaxID=2755281 RepID=UPI003082826D
MPVYSLKKIKWKDNFFNILCQNENGSCPLLAICNILILRSQLRLPRDTNSVTDEVLYSLLVDLLNCIMSRQSSSAFQLRISDCLEIFPQLQTGLDVNVKFSKVTGFEFTRQLEIFDVFGIKLYHGWLPDPETDAGASLLENLSYNQAVEKLLLLQSEDSTEEEKLEGALLELFFQSYPTQLTPYGLLQLTIELPEEELVVFFRNNHFSVLYKMGGKLHALVTDQGYLHQPVVWETLEDVFGRATALLDGNLVPYMEKELDVLQQKSEASRKRVCV